MVDQEELLRKEEIVVQQAITAVHNEERQKQSYNRFKE
jgi:hypothetical protein